MVSEYTGVSDRKCGFFSFAYITILCGSLGVAIYNGSQGTSGLGTKTTIGQALNTFTIAIDSIMIVIAGLELIMRASMSAFLVYPCDFQKRAFCCVQYKMPTFWIVCTVLSGLLLFVSAALSILLFVLDDGYPAINITRVAVMCGVALLQFVCSWVSLKMARVELALEIEADIESRGQPETVPLEQAPASPSTASPSLSSPTSPSAEAVGSPSSKKPASPGQPAN